MERVEGINFVVVGEDNDVSYAEIKAYFSHADARSCYIESHVNRWLEDEDIPTSFCDHDSTAIVSSFPLNETNSSNIFLQL